MDRVESISQCKTLITEGKKRFIKTDTNCFVMISSFSSRIEEKCLYYEWYRDGLYLLLDEGNYYELYYFWDHAAPFAGLHQDIPVVLSEFDRFGRREEYITYIGDKAKAAGFCFKKKNSWFELELRTHEGDIQTRYTESMCRMDAEGFHIVPCRTGAQIKQILALWEDALDKTDITKRHTDFMKHDDIEVLCVSDRLGEIMGTYLCEYKGKNAGVGWHLVTRSDQAKKGIGTALVTYFMHDLLVKGADFWQAWIAEENTRSVRMHEGYGCIRNGNTSTQYILKGDK